VKRVRSSRKNLRKRQEKGIKKMAESLLALMTALLYQEDLYKYRYEYMIVRISLFLC
jgi:hypothetical protein